MIFNPSTVIAKNYIPEDEKGLKLGILDLNVQESHDPFLRRNYARLSAFKEVFPLPEFGKNIKRSIELRNQNIPWPNPTIFRRKRPSETLIKETKFDSTNNLDDTETILVVFEKPKLNMYALGSA